MTFDQVCLVCLVKLVEWLNRELFRSPRLNGPWDVALVLLVQMVRIGEGGYQNRAKSPTKIERQIHFTG